MNPPVFGRHLMVKEILVTASVPVVLVGVALAGSTKIVRLVYELSP
jgi:hypothetical protein